MSCRPFTRALFLSIPSVFTCAALLLAPPVRAGDDTPIAPSLPAAVEISPYSVAERGANHRVWERVTARTNDSGNVIYHTNSFKELETGMHHLVNGQWVESTTDIQLTATGAQATNGQHQVTFASNINTPVAVDLTLPDGNHLSSHILGLSYFDAATGSNVLIAEIQDSIGQVVPPNVALYTNAFTDFNASVRYTYTKAGFTQDIILNQQPPSPAEWNLNSASTKLQILTEFINPPNPAITTYQIGDLADETLDFGMQMGPGKAFSFGNSTNDSGAVPVTKQWTTLQGRTFLVEEVPYQAITSQLQQLPAFTNTIASLQPANGSILHQLMARRMLPAPRYAKGNDGPMRLAGNATARQGFVLDYSLWLSQTNYTFQSDTTYYVTNAVSLSGTTTIEGGTVVKFSTNSTAGITISGTNLLCLTGAYRPAIFTAKDDNTVGETIAGSTGTPTNFYGGISLDLSALTSPVVSGLRFSHLSDALAGTAITLRNSQIIQCLHGFALDSLHATLLNVLVYEVGTLLYDCDKGCGGDFVVAENVTAHHCTNFIADLTSNLYLTNCLFADVGSWNSLYTYTNNDVILVSDTGVFQTVGAGSHYLADGSTSRNAGTTNIDAGLLADLQQKTTYPPVIFGPGYYSTNVALYPQALRDTDAPDLGYHYDVLDYAFGSAYFTNATLTFYPGTSVAAFGTNGGNYGFGIGRGGQLVCIGVPNNLNHIVLFNTVQEQANTNWYRPSAGSVITEYLGLLPNAVLNCRFTDWSILAQDTYHLDAEYGNCAPVTLQDCQFHGGLLNSPQITLNLTNCLLERVNSAIVSSDGAIAYFRNNLFYGGVFDVFLGNTNSVIRDNLFDGTAIPNEGNSYYGGYNGYNKGYATNCDRLLPSYASDVLVTNFTYQTGPLGNYYQTNNSPLINVGSTTADLVGLYHYTTTTNQVKETNSIVDIGFHYVAVDTNGAPFDTDGGGGPDYLEDANGNGTVDAGESDWTAGHGGDDFHVILSPEYLRCEYRQNPWGINAPTPGTTNQHPRLYWTVKSDRRYQMQRAWQILVAGSEANLNANYGDLWDSGKVLSDQTTHVEYNGTALQSNQRLWWKVRTWDKYYDLPSAWSTNAFWQMGLLSTNNWQAQWLTTVATSLANITPMFRKTFLQTNSVKRATVYVTARGVYELWINGSRIGNNVLAPEWTDYNKRIQYQTFDVTTNLYSGTATSTNVLGAIVAEGWFSGTIANNHYDAGAGSGGKKQILIQLNIENNDGTTTNIFTDNSWKCYTGGPIQKSSIYDGETFDARQEGSISNWSTYLYTNEATYFTAAITTNSLNASLLVPQPDDPIQIIQNITPVAMWTNTEVFPNIGSRFVTIFDMGQNMVGWCSLTVTNATNGMNIFLRHAELLTVNGSNFPVTNGTLFINNLGTALQSDTNISSGSSLEIFEPHFTYHGFRYVEVVAPPSVATNFTLNSITGHVIHSSDPFTGSFTCSDTNVSKLMTNTLWSQRGNLTGVPTDCPQRNERFGWMGDSQVFAQTACFNMDMAAFYTKFIRDIRDDQGVTGITGQYPIYAPYNGVAPQADIGWQIAGLILPWRLYENYGDTRILGEHYLSASSYVSYLTNTFPYHDVDTSGPYSGFLDTAFGDWLSMDQFNGLPSGWPDYPSGYLASVAGHNYECCLFAHSADLLAGMSQVLQMPAQYTYYTNLANEIRTNYFYEQGAINILTNSSGNITNIGNGAQSDFTFALYFDMVPQTQRVYCVDLLLNKTNQGIYQYYHHTGGLSSDTNLLSTGIQASGRAMLELSRDGYTPLAYQILTNLDFPQWLYSVTNGTPGVYQETTIPEHWNSYVSGTGGGYLSVANSFNHYAFGSVGEWIYKIIGGISPDDNYPGYKNVVINPQPGGGITNASTTFNSIHGLIATAWTNNAATTNYNLSVTVPANTTASVYLPATNLSNIAESGLSSTNFNGLLFYQITNGNTLFQVGSGVYNFTVTGP
jgi:alpha-L-rhamnosidase